MTFKYIHYIYVLVVPVSGAKNLGRDDGESADNIVATTRMREFQSINIMDIILAHSLNLWLGGCKLPFLAKIGHVRFVPCFQGSVSHISTKRQAKKTEM